MQNVLKRTYMYLDGIQVILIFPPKLYFLDYSEYINMYTYISKNENKKIIFVGVRKNGFCLEGGGRRSESNGQVHNY